ncbi:MAG: head-tail adaptor protein [Bacteroidales bacterium]|nr:head-tail adaptor protein [Bacteroidales bacterium]
MIFAGAMRERLSFYNVEEAQSASGYKSSQEQFMFSCRAGRERTSENYVVDSGELFHSNELTFRLRQRNIKETDMVQYNGDKYRITSIDKYPMQNEMVIKIEKVNE